MKKISIILCSLWMFICPVKAQVESMYGDAVKVDVKMKYVFSFDEALAKAKKENKLIFFNCFSDWAVPCHGMNQAVFSNQEFADWMDQHFVNLFIDVTTDEGRPLAKKYNAKVMAHYLVLDSEGNVVHRIVGGSQLPDFQEQVARALSPETSLAGMTKSYEAGERDVNFLGAYAGVLRRAEEEDKYNQVVEEYLDKLDPSEWAKKENAFFFWDKVTKPEGKMFEYLLEHKDDFVKYNGDTIINNRIAGLCFMPVFQMAAGKVTYNGAKLDAIYAIVQKAGIPENHSIYLMFRIARLRHEKKIPEMLDIFRDHLSDLDPRVISELDVSLRGLQDVSENEKQQVVNYLNEQMKNLSGSRLALYQGTTKEMVDPSGIRFAYLPFEEALRKSKETGKPIFLDCYTMWCGPCKMMSQRVFTQKYIGEYFNEHFISLKIDMEKEEGPELAEKYNVSGYPTMLIISPDGTVKYRIMGAMEPRVFMEKIERGLQPGVSYSDLKAKYEAGDRSVEIMPDYLIAANDAGELKDADNQVIEYLKTLQGNDCYRKSVWKLYDCFISDYKSSDFKFLMENRKKFIVEVEEEVVNKKIERVLFPPVIGYLEGTTSSADMGLIRKLIEDADFSADFSLALLTKVVTLYDKKDYNGIVRFYEKRVGKLPNGHTKLNLDVLLSSLMQEAPAAQRGQALTYAKQAAATVDKRAMNSYGSLIQALSN